MKTGNYITTINRRINELLGLHFRESQYRDLERNVILAANALGLNPSLEVIGQWLSTQKITHHELEILAHHLTVGETYFFREKFALKLLTEKIVPDFLENRTNPADKKLRIWSAGCSSGEEPYSIAMAIKESAPDVAKRDLMILATDVNTRALNKAREGVYTPWSFREIPDRLKKKYFTQKGKHLHVNPDIKQMVQFEQLNLATDDFPSKSGSNFPMDVIFCRNVLMYFSPEVISRITQQLFHTLKDDGWLITGQVELNDDYFSAFQRILFENGIFYRKAPPEQKQKQPLKVMKPLPAVSENRDSRQKPIVSKKIAVPRGASKKGSPVTHRNSSPKSQPTIQASDNAASLFESVTMLANAGNLDEAEAKMKQVLETENAGAEHFFLYATILMEKNQQEQADKNLIKALYLNPEHHAARFSRTRLLKSMGRNREAKKEMQNLMQDIEMYDDNEPLAALDGMTAGRLRQMAGLLTPNGTR